MELLQGGAVPGATDDATAAPPATRPSYPYDAARTLSLLANLIDESLALRGVGIGIRDWAAAFVGVGTSELVSASATPDALDSVLVGIALARTMETTPPLGMIGYDQEEPPEWWHADLGELSVDVPVSLAARFEAGTLLDAPVVVAVESPHHLPGLRVRVYSHPDDRVAARGWLDDLVERARAGDNPFRGRILETVSTQIGLGFRVARPAPTRREDVVVPARVWEVLDRNVTGLFAGLDRLRSAGLATNRGILLAGPPGTGKTAVCRALANEVAGQATVVFCDAPSVQQSLPELYRQLRRLAPAVVVMEDVDLVIGDRSAGGSSALLDFLLALDGAMSGHEGVVTIATTNAPHAIDPAARRASRLDVVVDVPLPPHAARVAILQRYLRDVAEAVPGGDAIDVERVADAAAGLSGADLRELVSDAVLHVVAAERDGPPAVLDTASLVRLAVARRPPSVPGLYL